MATTCVTLIERLKSSSPAADDWGRFTEIYTPLLLFGDNSGSVFLTPIEPLNSRRGVASQDRSAKNSNHRNWKPVYRVGQILAVMEEFVLDEREEVLIFNDGETRQVENESWMWGFASRVNRRFDPIYLPLWGVRTWLEVSSCLPQLIDGTWNWETLVQQVPSSVKAIPRSRQRFLACEAL